MRLLSYILFAPVGALTVWVLCAAHHYTNEASLGLAALTYLGVVEFVKFLCGGYDAEIDLKDFWKDLLD